MARSGATREGRGTRRPPGRPPTINHDRIVAAASQMAPADLSMRLGVSVQALYTHLSGRDELLRLLNQRTLATMEVPPRGGRHWREWLLDYACAARALLLRCPSLITHVDVSAPGSPTSLDHTERALEVLVQAGFPDTEALATWDLLGRFLTGWVSGELAYESAARTGNPFRRLYEQMATRRPDEVPVMNRLLHRLPSHTWPAPGAFEEAVRTLLAGVAARRRSQRAAMRIARPRVEAVSRQEAPRSRDNRPAARKVKIRRRGSIG
jgi:hypothetical protein